MGGGSLFGLIMLIGSIVLYALGRIKPEIRRDSDLIYVIVGIIYAIVTIASANMAVVPPGIVEFQNLLAIGCIISLMWQNIRDRQSSPQQMSGRDGGAFDNLRQRFAGDSRRRPDPRNAGRPDPGVYRYEASLDDYDRFGEPRPGQRRISGSEPPRGGGYGDRRDRYDEPGRRPGFDERGRDGRGDFAGGRPDGPPGRRPERGPERGPRRNDWEEDNYVDGRRPPTPPKDGFGPERNPRGRGPARPRDERSMEGRPLSRPLEDESRPPVGGPVNTATAPGPNGPSGMDRPPLDMPPRRRPRANGPVGNGPVNNGPVNNGLVDRSGAPMGGGYGPSPDNFQNGPGGGDRPNRRPPGAERPVIDATPAGGNRPPLTPPPGAPMQPLDAPSKDDYVDFRPVTPPPDSERDNSDQFDD